jgi:hypothetical protein
MSPSAIVQKLLPASSDAQVNWNSACLVLLGLPVRGTQAGAQAGAMSYLLARGVQASGDNPSMRLRAGVEQLTYLLFLKWPTSGQSLHYSQSLA